MVIADKAFLRFVGVGCSNVLVSYTVFMFCTTCFVWQSSITIKLSQALSYGAGILWSYFWNSKWTFQEYHDNKFKVFLKFLAVQLAMLIISVFLVEIMVNALKDKTSGWIIGMGVVTVVNFYCLKYLVFIKT